MLYRPFETISLLDPLSFRSGYKNAINHSLLQYHQKYFERNMILLQPRDFFEKSSGLIQCIPTCGCRLMGILGALIRGLPPNLSLNFIFISLANNSFGFGYNFF